MTTIINEVSDLMKIDLNENQLIMLVKAVGNWSDENKNKAIEELAKWIERTHTIVDICEYGLCPLPKCKKAHRRTEDW